ncbi:MAG: zinc-binding alcohol dehydrogenase [Chloroflexota bacterium]|nr:zinc-binding alcohol dehydrogenase [Chloroflexota bacterium]
MSETRIIRSLGVEAVGQAYFFSYEEGPPPPDHFRLDTLYTGISAGTELTFFTGTNPYLHSSWNPEFGLFQPGAPDIAYPMPFLGYMEVGRVIESRTPAVKEGQIVAMAYGHKTGHTVNPVHEFFVPLPGEIDPLLGIYAAQMGPICANGLLHAAADAVGYDVRTLGDGVRGRNVLIIGAGVVGQLTGLLARYHGAAQVVITNRTPHRLAAAAAMGMTTLNETEIEPWRYCKEQWHHGPNDRGADVVFQCRAEANSLQMALRSLRPQGTVIDMAFYQGGANEVRLGEEFHHNGLNIRCAQINRVPRGLSHSWNKRRLANETVALLQAYGGLIRQHLITDIVPFDQGPEFLDGMAAAYNPKILQAVLEVPHAIAAGADFMSHFAAYQPQGNSLASETAHE